MIRVYRRPSAVKLSRLKVLKLVIGNVFRVGHKVITTWILTPPVPLHDVYKVAENSSSIKLKKTEKAFDVRNGGPVAQTSNFIWIPISKVVGFKNHDGSTRRTKRAV